MHSLQEDAALMQKALYGEKLVHVPINMILQGAGENRTAGLFQFEMPDVSPLWYGQDGNKCHLLIMGDAIIRPRLIVKSKHLMGEGVGGIYRNGFDPIAWAEKGEVIYMP